MDQENKRRWSIRIKRMDDDKTFIDHVFEFPAVPQAEDQAREALAQIPKGGLVPTAPRGGGSEAMLTTHGWRIVAMFEVDPVR